MVLMVVNIDHACLKIQRHIRIQVMHAHLVTKTQNKMTLTGRRHF